MKPAAFKYALPRTLDEALAEKAEHGDEAMFLAGGQSLIPAMNFRLAQPAVLIDINALEELAFIRIDDASGALHLGAELCIVYRAHLAISERYVKIRNQGVPLE